MELNRLFSSQDSILLDKQQDMIISLLPEGATCARVRPHAACVRVQPGARALCACRRVCTHCCVSVRARLRVRTCVLYAVVAHGFLLLCRGRDGLSKGCGWATDVSLGLGLGLSQSG